MTTTGKGKAHMKKLLIVLAALGLVMGISSPMWALPVGFICPGGAAGDNPALPILCASVTFQTPSGVTQQLAFLIPFLTELKANGETIYVIDHPGRPAFEINNPGLGFRIVLSGTLNTDPSIDVAITAANTNSVAKDFRFQFIEPIVPQTFPNDVIGSLQGTLTDDARTSGVILTALAPLVVPADTDGLNEIAVYTLSTAGAGPFTSMGVDVGLGGTFSRILPSIPSISYPLAFASLIPGGPDPGAGNTWNYLRADIGFNLSGYDTAQFTGSGYISNEGHEPAAVPEPSTLLLLGSGLVGLGFVVTRRRNRSR